MASPPDEIVAYMRRVYSCGAGSPTAEERFLDRLRKLDAIVAALKSSPLAPFTKVFGSALRDDGLVPGDVDCLIEGPYGKAFMEGPYALAMRETIWLGEAENYGLFDPFRIVRHAGGRQQLQVRGAERVRNDWTVADPETADAIVAAGRAGIPVLGFDRSFAAEFGNLAPSAAHAPAV